MDEAPEPIHRVLAKVAADLPPIGKDDQAPAAMGGFHFRGIERIMREVGPLFQAAGVIVMPEVIDRDVEARPPGSSGNDRRLVTLTMRFRFYGPAGDWLEATTVGEGADGSDKAAPKAMTTAYKYALIQVLQIGEGIDVESGGGEGPPRQPVYNVDEMVRPLIDQWGAEHAARVAALLRVMNDWPIDERRVGKRAFAARFDSGPLEIPPELLGEAEEWTADRDVVVRAEEPSPGDPEASGAQPTDPGGSAGK